MFVVLDTDVASFLHLGRLPGSLAVSLARVAPCLTFVTYGELTKWMDLRSWGERSRQKLTSWMDRRPILGYDESVAVVWGELAAAAQRRGRPFGSSTERPPTPLDF